MTIALRRQPEAAGRRERAVVRAVMLMMWPLAAAASSLQRSRLPSLFTLIPPLARRLFAGSGHLLSAVYLGLSAWPSEIQSTLNTHTHGGAGMKA